MIKNYIDLLTSFEDFPYSAECLKSIQEDEIIITRNNIDNIKQLLVLYTDRYNIQKNVVKQETVLGYEFLLDNLRQKDENLIVRTTYIFKENFGFIILSTEDKPNLIGILKTFNSSIEKIKKLALIYKEKGLETNYYMFNEGKPKSFF